ncbi:dTDP-4-dehydrorhamnose reductase [Pseudoduganella albidiflava]|uniref:dTDP-4-dehydrorhamnose reductase n=1 Tax=Pseudoduganella albidiflava TaxID=321983 RepID=A0A411WT39_9BURK|nr:dTDP-4-dehydrorhamnose reductase [Pseudoduganella albidiflava]QBH99811.1 dTDP-4-dehydrorhamnose reductase [Pseudoduganella albidiflava]GGY63221.1 NAD(P)-dependent oxidoreductase [Pseudoduganella albidiflava]
MKILLTGSTGQVGYELERSLQGLGEVVAVDRTRMDLADLDQVRDVIRAVRPQLIVNPAAYTAVDKAESDTELAYRINAEAPAVMAAEAKALGAALVHYSTDYVFSGHEAQPRREDDPVGPLNVYGASKLEGERAIAASGVPHLIFRTSWVYGMRGKNFLLTVLRLAKEREELRIVDDQHGAPTWSRTIADTTALILAQARAGGQPWWDANGGMYHLASQGRTTWCGFTQAILEEAGIACRLVPITTDQYPLPAPRPQFSALDTSRLQERFVLLPEWREALRLCLG